MPLRLSVFPPDTISMEARTLPAMLERTEQPEPSVHTANPLNTLASETINTANKMLWGIGKFILSTSESANFIWDIILNSILNLLKTGGATYNAVAAKISQVPVLGFGANGVNELIKTSLDAMESNAKHDMETRKNALATLNQQMIESGAKLSVKTDTNPSTNFNTIFFPSN